jgi:hypothetical protein
MNTGIIYKISCNITGEDYYGSTKRDIKTRIEAHHRMDCSSARIIARGNYSYTQLEVIKYNDEKELLTREKYYYKKYPNINQHSPINTIEEKRERKKLQEQKPRARETKRLYYLNHKKQMNDYGKEYYKKNFQAVSAKSGKKIECECGCYYTYSHKARHISSKRHQKIYQETTSLAPLFSEEFYAVLI